MKTEKNVDIKIHSRNIKYYLEKGYYYIKLNEVVPIKSIDVAPKVATRIYVVCQNCNKEKYIKSNNYHLQIKRGNKYYCIECRQIKVKETNLKRYGTICPLQNEDVAIKSKETLLKEFGVDNISKLESIKDSRRNNFKSENFKNKSKETCFIKYGFDNPSKSLYIKKKKKETTLFNYGVENPSQSSEIFERSQISGKKIKLHKLGLMYRGSYEKDFLDFCFDNQIKVEKGLTFEYCFNGKKKYYHSDFFIPLMNLVIEIKSSYYYGLYEEINLAKMKSVKEKGYSFVFIIDKNYQYFDELLNDFSYICLWKKKY